MNLLMLKMYAFGVGKNLIDKGNTNMIICPKCNSESIVNQRIDSDWHNSPCSAVNDEKCYNPKDWKRIDNGQMQIDVNIYHCLNCKHDF